MVIEWLYLHVLSSPDTMLEDDMQLEQDVQFGSVLDCLSTGVVVIDIKHFRIHYSNTYAQAQLEKLGDTTLLPHGEIDDILPQPLSNIAQEHLRQIARSRQSFTYKEIPFEGFLETRGKTYWNIHVSLAPAPLLTSLSLNTEALIITFEDVTQTVRTRLHLHAIHKISSAIAGAHSLSLVLDCILDSVYELVGSTHCAIFLIDRISLRSDKEEQSLTSRTVTIAAQRGLHVSSQQWHPRIGQQLLLGQVEGKRQSLVIANTATFPHLQFPLLNTDGEPYRPEAALCVPIFERYASRSLQHEAFAEHRDEGRVIGTIEVYHPHSRQFPVEEIELLEQFAQQAGLAIQNARLFQDIDRLARAERRGARQQAHIMQAIPDGVIIVDPRWRIAETNATIRRLLGWTQEDDKDMSYSPLAGLPLERAFQQSSATLPSFLTTMSNPIAEFEQRAAQGQIDEFKMLGADGQSYTMRCTYTPICDDLGDTFAFIVTFHDVTSEVAARERIETEVIVRTQELAQRNEALQQAQLAQETERARLELLIERLPSGVLLLSAHDTSIITINNYALELLHRLGVQTTEVSDAKQLIGANGEHLLQQVVVRTASGIVVPYSEQPLIQALYEGKAMEQELHATDKDGQAFCLLANAAPLRAADGTITSAILVLIDITTLKTLERAREDFFTTMAHELKTPLANVRAHLSALLATDVMWSLDEQRDFLQTADEQVERLVSMINRVLEAFRIEAHSLRPHTEPVLLSELIEDTQDRLAALIATSGRRLEVCMSPHLPFIEADYDLIISVLTNLLSNAFRYAPEGDSVTLSAELAYHSETTQPAGVTLSVCDRGPGISPEQQKQLFSRFSTFTGTHQAHQAQQLATQSHTRWSPATGLGLYICRGILEAHNSSLQLVSQPSQGTRFSFTLPIAVSKRIPENPES